MVPFPLNLTFQLLLLPKPQGQNYQKKKGSIILKIMCAQGQGVKYCKWSLVKANFDNDFSSVRSLSFVQTLVGRFLIIHLDYYKFIGSNFQCI